MSRTFACFPEVVRRANETFAQKIGPDSIHVDTGCQRVLRRRDPVREFSATTGRFERFAGKCWQFCRRCYAEESSWNLWSEVADFAANMHMPVFRRRFVLNAHCDRDFRLLFGQFFTFFFQPLKFRFSMFDSLPAFSLLSGFCNSGSG